MHVRLRRRLMKIPSGSRTRRTTSTFNQDPYLMTWLVVKNPKTEQLTTEKTINRLE